jgi:hypothetical protein
MKLKFHLTALVFLPSIILLSQPVQITEDIIENTFWQDDTIILTTAIKVLPEITLTIQPGTVILGKLGSSLTILGNLQAIGSDALPIVFSALDTFNFHDSTKIDGSWEGLIFSDSLDIQDTSRIQYCIFEYAKAFVREGVKKEGKGGSILLKTHNRLIIKNCFFRNNFANRGGGSISLGENSFALIENSRFEYNQALFHGGAIHSWTNSGPVIENCVFLKNNVISVDTFSGLIRTFGSGGAIACSSGFLGRQPIIRNNLISNNYGIAAIWESCTGIEISGNIISNNYGGGIFNGISRSNSIYFNNTIMNNESDGISLAIRDNVIGRLSIINNCIRNNTGFGRAADIFNAFNHPSPRIYHNNVPGDWSAFGEGNIDVEPNFINPSNVIGISNDEPDVNWALSKTSDLIDAGTTEFIDQLLPETDLSNTPRILNGKIDIGALEYDPSASIENPEDPRNPLNIYPNPFSDLLWLEPKNQNETYQLIITDLNGRLIQNRTIQNTQALNLGHLSQGTYLLTISSNNLPRFSTKIIKQ